MNDSSTGLPYALAKDAAASGLGSEPGENQRPTLAPVIPILRPISAFASAVVARTNDFQVMVGSLGVDSVMH